MARPRKVDNKKQTHSLPPVRCSAIEHARITGKSKKAGLSLSAFIRQSLLYSPPTIKGTEMNKIELIVNLKKMGTYLNQMLKNHDSFNHLPPDKFNRVLDKTNEALDLLISDIKKNK